MDYEGIHYEARILWNRGFQPLEILYSGSICALVHKRSSSVIDKLNAAKSPGEIDTILEWAAGHLAN